MFARLALLFWPAFRLAHRRWWLISRPLVYLDQRLVWWAGWGALLAGWVILRGHEGDPLDGALTGAIYAGNLLIFRFAAGQHPEAPSATIILLVEFYEFFVWLYVVLAVFLALGGQPGGPAAAVPATALARTGLYCVYSYLACDLVGGPRARKRVRIPRPSLRLSLAPMPA